MKWKEYYILGEIKDYRFIVKNNWHYFQTEEWHLISFFRKFRNTEYDYYFCILGFQLRIFLTGKGRFNKRQKL